MTPFSAIAGGTIWQKIQILLCDLAQFLTCREKSLTIYLTVPPSMSGTPNLLLSTPNLESTSATRRSAISANSRPPATHHLELMMELDFMARKTVRSWMNAYTHPSIAAITGLVSSILVGPMGPLSIILAATTLAKFCKLKASRVSSHFFWTAI